MISLEAQGRGGVPEGLRSIRIPEIHKPSGQVDTSISIEQTRLLQLHLRTVDHQHTTTQPHNPSSIHSPCLFSSRFSLPWSSFQRYCSSAAIHFVPCSRPFLVFSYLSSIPVHSHPGPSFCLVCLVRCPLCQHPLLRLLPRLRHQHQHPSCDFDLISSIYLVYLLLSQFRHLPSQAPHLAQLHLPRLGLPAYPPESRSDCLSTPS